MKQDIRLLEYLENTTEESFLNIGQVTWQATAKLQVFKGGVPAGNHFIFKYALEKDIVPRDLWSKQQRGVTDRSIVFVIEIPKQSGNNCFHVAETKIFIPYAIHDDWDFYNYYRQDVQKINSKYNLGLGEREWYGLFMHYMPDGCLRPFRALKKVEQLV